MQREGKQKGEKEKQREEEKEEEEEEEEEEENVNRESAWACVNGRDDRMMIIDTNVRWSTVRLTIPTHQWEVAIFSTWMFAGISAKSERVRDFKKCNNNGLLILYFLFCSKKGYVVKKNASITRKKKKKKATNNVVTFSDLPGSVYNNLSRRWQSIVFHFLNSIIREKRNFWLASGSLSNKTLLVFYNG